MRESWKGVSGELLLKQCIHAVFPSATLKVCHCEHHYVFYICLPGDNQPVIIAVLHERMDMLVRLKTRLC